MTYSLIDLIGTPFLDRQKKTNNARIEQIYEKAFDNRIALLCLHIHRNMEWSYSLETLYSRLEERRIKTLSVISNLSYELNDICPKDYAIFKSIKPYPATPNDTDVIIFGDKNRFNYVVNCLISKGYCFHEWAPMQTTLYDPRGKSKIGKGKKGGIYYVDVYAEISTDYFMYIDKRYLIPHVHSIELNGIQIKTIRKEIELAIILYHNIFPERTFLLEHFYMPLYLLKERDFDLNTFIEFVEKQKLEYALSTNLTIVEYLHTKMFHFVPDRIRELLDRWGRNEYEIERFKRTGEKTPYLFSPKIFWITFLHKISDNAALRSLFVQSLHMMNPIFFADVVKSLKNRFSERGTYHLE